LIEPLGFKVDAKSIKRSGVNYTEHVDYRLYRDWSSFVQNNPGQYVYLTRYGSKSPDQCVMTDTGEELYLIFGRESTGIPKSILAEHLGDCYRLPMNDLIRSLNLANVVCTVLYEALRQRGFPGLSLFEPETLKGADWLTKE
jgi:tRNA (cytidine/uridine-2'-O-)-methyltransferase